MTTAFVDTGSPAPNYVDTATDVSAPGASGITVEYRGATQLSGNAPGSSALFLQPDREQDTDLLDGAR